MKLFTWFKLLITRLHVKSFASKLSKHQYQVKQSTDLKNINWLKFKSYKLNSINFTRSVFYKVRFDSNTFTHCVFNECCFIDCSIECSDFEDVIFKNCTFKETTVSDTWLEGTLFTSCVFSTTQFNECAFTYVSFGTSKAEDVLLFTECHFLPQVLMKKIENRQGLHFKQCKGDTDLFISSVIGDLPELNIEEYIQVSTHKYHKQVWLDCMQSSMVPAGISTDWWNTHQAILKTLITGEPQ